MIIYPCPECYDNASKYRRKNLPDTGGELCRWHLMEARAD